MEVHVQVYVLCVNCRYRSVLCGSFKNKDMFPFFLFHFFAVFHILLFPSLDFLNTEHLFNLKVSCI